MSSPNRNDWKPEAAPFVPGATAGVSISKPQLTPAATEFHPGYMTRQQSDPTTSSTGLAPTAQEFRPNTAYPSQAYANSGMPGYQVEPASYATDAEVFNAAEQIIEAPKLIPRSCRPLPDKRTFGNSKMLPDDVRSYYAHQAKLILEELAPDSPRLNEVPREFHSVLPLDNPNKKAGKAGSSGYPTSLYKVVSSNDGYVYCLRRVDNVRRGLHGLCAKAAQEWSGVHHPSIVPLRNAFERRGALFFQYDYFAGAQNLHDYITARGNGNLLPEKVIWSMSLQVLSAIRYVHANHMACRCINPSSIIVCGRQRVRLSGVGLMDVLERDSTMSLAEHQQEDLANMGRIVLVLACMSMQAIQDVGSTVEFVRSTHSPELAGVVTALLTRPCNLQRVLAQCGNQLAQCMDTTLQHADALEEHVSLLIIMSFSHAFDSGYELYMLQHY